MTANKFKLDVPKPEVVDDWDLRQVKYTLMRIEELLRYKRSTISRTYFMANKNQKFEYLPFYCVRQ